jgi:hypothetical protein
MAVRLERPPNFDLIVAKFPAAAGENILFAYGDDIFNPSGGDITRPLMEHELRHCARQVVHGADQWWADYIAQDGFRYQEELFAHAAEYVVHLKTRKDRNDRARALQRIAQRFMLPLYQYPPGVVTLPKVMRDIRWLSEQM